MQDGGPKIGSNDRLEKKLATTFYKLQYVVWVQPAVEIDWLSYTQDELRVWPISLIYHLSERRITCAVVYSLAA